MAKQTQPDLPHTADDPPARRGCSLAAVAVLGLIVWIMVIVISYFSGFRQMVQEQLYKQTGMTFVVERAHLDLQWDLVLKGVEWSDDESLMGSARSERLVLRWRFFRSLIEKQFIIDHVELEGMDATLSVSQADYFSLPNPKDLAGYLVDLARPYGFFQDPFRRHLHVLSGRWTWQDPSVAGRPDQAYFVWDELSINVAPIHIPSGVMRDHVMVRAAIHPPGEGGRVPMQREFLVLPAFEDRPPELVMVDE